ncbi:MAG: RNA polymerase subunit sigma-70 [Candidatus Thermoplasmatota archaeon]|nr:RNA polymerase subunit sigma-70 [Candidatus Thermoplasmatota archaeon]
MYTHFDEVAVKLMLGAESGDSIRRIAQKIDEPYETVRQKVKDLEEKDILKIENGVHVIAPEIVKSIYQLAIAGSKYFPLSIEDVYVLPHFADHFFAFTRIDAAYIWTRGGYQVARSPDDYAIFIRVDSCIEYWINFFADFGISAYEKRRPVEDIEGDIQVVIEKGELSDIEWIEGKPVIPLEETVGYMQENSVHFQPALDMIDEMYQDADKKISYTSGGT